MKRFEALLWASSLLEEAHLEENYAKMYLQALLREDSTQFILNRDKLISNKIVHEFQQGIHQHIQTGIPYQHLVGWAEFYGEQFKVTKDTLIPRFETEELIEWILKDQFSQSKTLVDIGTGTGIIAITLKKYCPHYHVIMTDINDETLNIARLNAKKHQVDILAWLGDALHPLIERQQKVDIIVSNPPYIAWEELSSLSPTVVDFDPHQALFAKQQGLAIYQRIIKQLKYVLQPQGYVYFEIGHNQASAITAIVLYHYPQARITIKQDLNGKDRMMKISNLI